jgi:hypothetical protein
MNGSCDKMPVYTFTSIKVSHQYQIDVYRVDGAKEGTVHGHCHMLDQIKTMRLKHSEGAM